MSNYVYGINVSYHDYLHQPSSSVGQIRYEISEQARNIIASNEELQREHIEVSKSIADAVSSGFAQLSVDMRAISSGITELTSLFEWGFSELLVGVGRINDSLTELVKISKTPAQTWAYEQFEIARDAFRQGLYEEALEYLNRAIEGHGDHTGHKLEYRFHFLLGTIRLGSFQNNSPSIIDLVKAEKAFLTAAKYARHDQPNEAGRAFLAGGWSAYCQGNISDAEKYTEQAISLNPELGEAHFQLAKIIMHRGDPKNALSPLRKAIGLDRNFAIKASSDDDFKKYDKQVINLIKKLHDETRDKFNNDLILLEKEKLQFEEAHVQEFSSIGYVDMSPIGNVIEQAKKAVSNNTYFGYLDALSYCAEAKNSLVKSNQEFLESALNDVASKLENLNPIRKETKEGGFGWELLIILGIAISFVLSISQCSKMNDANERQAQIHKQAFEKMYGKMYSDLRSKGYTNPESLTIDQVRKYGYFKKIYSDFRSKGVTNLNGVTVDQVKKYGYSEEKMPPQEVGSAFNTWLGYLFFGVVISIVIGIVGKKTKMKSKLSEIETESSRLNKIKNELLELSKNPYLSDVKIENVKARAIYQGSDVKVGAIYKGRVALIRENGKAAFVSILPGKDGLVHDAYSLSVGDTVKVEVAKVDKEGRIFLTRVLE